MNTIADHHGRTRAGGGRRRTARLGHHADPVGPGGGVPGPLDLDDGGPTEELRVALGRYREFFDRPLSW